MIGSQSRSTRSSFGYHEPENLPTGAPPICGEVSDRVELIDIDMASDALLRRLGKDARLISYGGANFGMPLDLIEPAQGRVVPNDRFFVRSNGPVPVLDEATWQMEITGAVVQPIALSLDDLQRLPRRQLESFLECAGNGRTRFDPVPPGTPWRNDAVGNAHWEGVSLGDVLDLAEVRADAVDVVTQGADFPDMRRGLPIGVARDPDTLIVWRMNGEPLPIAHGGPVRLLVPGWAGIASTKWLIGLEVVDRPFAGFWNVDNYVFWDERGDPLRPVAEMPPKSLIATPGDGAIIAAGPTTIAGWAWSGYAPIHMVEVSVDGGDTWQCAALEPAGHRSWWRWSVLWEAEPGDYRLQARATDERRLRQPATAPWNAKGYQMNAIQEIAVRVDS